jgi:hypothetical protein
MSCPLHLAHFQAGLAARVPALRGPSGAAPGGPVEGQTCRRFLRTPGTQTPAFPAVPTHTPDRYVRDITPPWYGLGGTG